MQLLPFVEPSIAMDEEKKKRSNDGLRSERSQFGARSAPITFSQYPCTCLTRMQTTTQNDRKPNPRSSDKTIPTWLPISLVRPPFPTNFIVLNMILVSYYDSLR